MNQETPVSVNSRPLIKLDNLTLRLHDQQFFPHTNWTITYGQHWAIVGPNGSGKSILAGALCRKIPVHEGHIYYFLDSGDPNRGQPYFNRGEIIMVSPDTQQDLLQHYGGYHQSRWQSFGGAEAPTVAEYLAGKSIEHVSPFEITPLKTDEDVYRARRDQAVALLGIEYLLGRKIHQLSNGEARKLLIVRALMQEPKLLILDEPFGGLDKASRELLKKIITGLIASTATRIMLVTSRPDEIPPEITHLLYVDNHRIVAQGLRSEVLQIAGKTGGRTALPAQAQPEIAPVKREKTLKQPVLVEMKDVAVSYNGVKVLNGINWSLRRGERWAVLGPNGAGKTTLLSLILADNPQGYSNEIYLFGRRRGGGESIWEIKRRIGWVSPELQMYYDTDLTCLEIVCSGFFDSIGLYRDCSVEQIRVAGSLMASFAIENLAESSFQAVSIGEQRLTLLARALVKDPALLILDEPCQGLDDGHRDSFVELLDRLCLATPISLIYVTHHPVELPRAVTHVLKLENGRITAAGPRGKVSLY
ncbi:MAG: ATP-binding cassette domain-containing protein [Bacillota bacterium]